MKLVSTEVAVGECGKANFDDIYIAPDPREYYRVLCGLGYVIPDLAKGVFRSLIDYCSQERKGPISVLDIGCSYGVNSAMIQYPLDIDWLLQRYSCPEMYQLSPEYMKVLDKNYFAGWPKRTDSVFYGVDISKPAMAYAKSVGLIQDGVTTNLETDEPTEHDKRIFENADLIITTGCVGYVTERTFQKIFDSLDKSKTPPIVASFVLRMYPYDEVAAVLEKGGLQTEKLEGMTFVQRRFNSSEEFDSTIAKLNKKGIDPTNKEMDGMYHAELFISRPKEMIQRTPLSDLLSVSSSAEKRFRRRFRDVGDGGPYLMQ